MLSLCYFHVTTLILLIMIENINKGKNVAKEYLVVFPGGVLPYSLGGSVPLGSRKSYPLLDQILQILWPSTRPKKLNCSWF